MAITGSLMPWLYYGCHCRVETLVAHVVLSLSLCVVCLVYIGVMFDEFVRQRCVKAGTSSGADGDVLLIWEPRVQENVCKNKKKR